jgi:hypothetical protein
VSAQRLFYLFSFGLKFYGYREMMRVGSHSEGAWFEYRAQCFGNASFVRSACSPETLPSRCCVMFSFSRYQLLLSRNINKPISLSLYTKLREVTEMRPCCIEQKRNMEHCFMQTFLGVHAQISNSAEIANCSFT